MDLFVLIVLLLLAAPIIGIVALIRSITDRNLLRQLDARVKALEQTQVVARAAAPAAARRRRRLQLLLHRLSPRLHLSRQRGHPRRCRFRRRRHAIVLAKDRLRRKIRHPLGGLGRRRGARARRHLFGALYDPAGPDRPGGADFSRRLAGAGAGRRRRMVAAHRETFGARRRAVGAYSRHADRGRHHRRLCHRLCGVRALRIPATGRRFHPARRRGALDLGRRVAAWTRARRPGRDRRLSGADAGCVHRSRISGRCMFTSPSSMRPLSRWRGFACGAGSPSRRSCWARCGRCRERRPIPSPRWARMSSTRLPASRWSPRFWSAA